MLLRSHLIPALMIVLAIAVAPAQAAYIEYTPYESGSIRVSGGLFGASASHSTPLTSIRGYQIAMASIVEYAQYLIFDTATLDFTPLYASLFFDANDTLRDLAGPGPLETWGLDSYAPADLLALPTGNLDTQVSLAADIASDLRGGTSLAPAVVGPEGLVRFDMNGTALAQIAAANSLWGLGLYDNRFGALLGGINVLSTPRLILSDEPISAPVSVPATQVLLLLALALIAARRRLH